MDRAMGFSRAEAPITDDLHFEELTEPLPPGGFLTRDAEPDHDPFESLNDRQGPTNTGPSDLLRRFLRERKEMADTPHLRSASPSPARRRTRQEASVQRLSTTRRSYPGRMTLKLSRIGPAVVEQGTGRLPFNRRSPRRRGTCNEE